MSYEKWSLGYWFLKMYVRFAELIIYKKIVIIGKDKIPGNKAIVFAPNHQNALSDPMAVLLNTPYQPVWLARADIFKNKTAARFLKFIKIMPVYRIRDGKDQLANNDKTFEESIKVLKSHKALALFPEAAHSGKRQMLIHKKAVPRIVFMAEEKSDENIDIHIVPTGIYYSSYWKFNRTVIVNFGDPLRVNDYLQLYEKNQNEATMALRDDLYNAIDKLIINIRSKEHYSEFELIREYYGKTFLKRQSKKYSTGELLNSDMKLMHQLDDLEKTSPEKTEQIVRDAKNYQKLLKQHHLRSWLIENPSGNFLRIVLNKLVLIIGIPVFLYGFIFNIIPFLLIDYFTRKKIKDFAFWSTFFLVLGILLFPIFYVIDLLIVGSMLPGAWLKIIFVITLPFAGKLAFLWHILLRKTWGRGNLFLLKLFSKKKYTSLIEAKDRLFDALNSFTSV
ncbi:MAG TPA: 1-acyl-sn-glycerol-3-phosphate acyltransferase [Draconibacterium sp.]|nr:1-acyl-sn-glycerol-3-phosphate acyltransferase [Draconibacterium sp.]